MSTSKEKLRRCGAFVENGGNMSNFYVEDLEKFILTLDPFDFTSQ